MSQPFPPNPYASPTSPPPVAPHAAPSAFKPIDKIEYMRMYNYIFEHPNWMMTVLLGALCMLIPVVGPLVMLGYQYEVVISLMTTQGLRYPEFDFNRFADYLMRGVWPFLVQLVASLVLAPVYLILFFVPFMTLMAIVAAAGERNSPLVFAVGLPLLLMVVIPLSILPAIALMPLMLRAGLAQDFAEAFNFNWAVDFVKKTWREMLVAMLFLALTGGVLAMLGMLACYIGLFAVMPVIFLAQSYLLYQLYSIYLTRGGTPVPVKVAMPQMMGKPM
jgi:hypothetical protein